MKIWKSFCVKIYKNCIEESNWLWVCNKIQCIHNSNPSIWIDISNKFSKPVIELNILDQKYLKIFIIQFFSENFPQISRFCNFITHFKTVEENPDSNLRILSSKGWKLCKKKNQVSVSQRFF